MRFALFVLTFFSTALASPPSLDIDPDVEFDQNGFVVLVTDGVPTQTLYGVVHYTSGTDSWGWTCNNGGIGLEFSGKIAEVGGWKRHVGIHVPSSPASGTGTCTILQNGTPTFSDINVAWQP